MRKRNLRSKINADKLYDKYMSIFGIIFITLISLLFFIGFLAIKYYKYALIILIAYVIVMIIFILSYKWNRKVYNECLKELDELENKKNEIDILKRSTFKN